MASVNKVIIVGNLGADPEVRYLPSGAAVCNLSIATTEKWKDGEETKEETTWHRVTLWGKQAEVAGEYLKKGSAVYIEGKIQHRKYKDKDGNEKTAFEVRGDRMQMLGSKGGGDRGASADEYAKASGGTSRKRAPAAAGAGHKAGGFDQMEDDIPF